MTPRGNWSLPSNATEESRPKKLCALRPGHKSILVGFGNPIYGDDAVGPLVARAVHRTLDGARTMDYAELCCSNFGLAETLVGYECAVIVDALVDENAEVGAVKVLKLGRGSGRRPMSLHTEGLEEAISLLRALALDVPDEIRVYAVTIREPRGFCEHLTPELEAKVPRIAKSIAASEAESGKRVDNA